MFCEKCGTKNSDNAAFCSKCGERLDTIAKVSITKEKYEQMGEQKVVFTTKKTNKSYLFTNVIMSILIDGAICWFLFKRATELIDSYWYASDGEKLLIVAFLVLGVGIIEVFYRLIVSSTYADIFEDRVVGKGMHRFQVKGFTLTFDQIVDISTSKGFLNIGSNPGSFLVITTIIGEYKIITTDECAKKIVEYYTHIKK